LAQFFSRKLFYSCPTGPEKCVKMWTVEQLYTLQITSDSRRLEVMCQCWCVRISDGNACELASLQSAATDTATADGPSVHLLWTRVANIIAGKLHLAPSLLHNLRLFQYFFDMLCLQLREVEAEFHIRNHDYDHNPTVT